MRQKAQKSGAAARSFRHGGHTGSQMLGARDAETGALEKEFTGGQERPRGSERRAWSMNGPRRTEQGKQRSLQPDLEESAPGCKRGKRLLRDSRSEKMQR